MKTRFIFAFIFLFTLSSIAEAQPSKGSFELGGSGHISKGKHVPGDESFTKKSFTMSLNGQVSYFIFRNLSAGVNIDYWGYKKYEYQSKPILDAFFIAPTVEAYLLNRNKVGISIKTSLNLTVSSDFASQDNGYSSFIIGPKVAWNITPNLSTFLWFAYRNTKNSDEYSQAGSIIPSDNFDMRWGFSYYLHRKKTENN